MEIKPLYHSDKVTLYQGDCLDVMPQLPDQSVDLAVCDFPYGEVNRASSGLRVLDKGIADLANDFDVEKVCIELCRAVSGSLYLFCGIEQVSLIRKTLVSLGLTTRLCVWEKTNPSPMNGEHLWLSSVECCVFGRKSNAPFNLHCASPVWRFSASQNKWHTTEKPILLLKHLIQASSNKGQTVLDATCGSGSTLAAARDTGRKSIGIEKDPEYCQIAIKRLDYIHWAQENPEKSVDEANGQLNLWTA